MDIIELGITGIILALFIPLLTVVSLVLGSALQHTGNVIDGVNGYNTDPSDENMQLMQKDLSASNIYLSDLRFVLSGALVVILDTIDTHTLSGSEKASLADTKDFFQKTEKRDISDPDVIGIHEMLENIK